MMNKSNDDSAQEANALMAAIDLGSNSFHMVVARVVQNEVRRVSRLSEKVHLGASLDRNNCLTEKGQARAFACLERFAQQIEGIDVSRVRVVGTNTLRAAKNGEAFRQKAEKVLGCPIEVISGREEARLIYLGVSHSLADDGEQRLVIDIGGGSTELILGCRFESQELESLHMGCVSYGLRYFPDGRIRKSGFDAAMLSARRQVRLIQGGLEKTGWQQVVGASGTVKAINQVVVANGWSEHGISYKSLEALRNEIVSVNHYSELSLPGLKENRMPVFASGVAILMGIFEQLKLTHMTVSDGALREGVLYDMLGRIQHEDVRDRTLLALLSRYDVDIPFAEKVRSAAPSALDQVEEQCGQESGHRRDLLSRAALVHELGLAISHSQFHKHGAYVLCHADLAGFGKLEQQALAFLVRAHRRKFPVPELEVFSEKDKVTLIQLSVFLRLAVLLCRGRNDKPYPEFTLRRRGSGFELNMQEAWLAAHSLASADLKEETVFLEEIGLKLDYK
ncbi:MAG: exopolyphosphatase [Pseudomonadales bacterium]|nr:exopolyphosphatase [Pseudomonadales bacterium]